MHRPRLFVSGAAHIDRRGRIDGIHIPGASNPGKLREEVGGGALNAARNALRHGVDVSLLSIRGGDISGDAVAEALSSCGINDLSAVFLDRTTPSYTALLDQDGELIAGLADMQLYDIGFTRQMRRRKVRAAVASAGAVLCDANMPSDALVRLSGLADGLPFHAIATSPAKVQRLQPILGNLSCLFMNRREALALTGTDDVTDASHRLRAMGLCCGVITAGAENTTIFDAGGIFSVSPPPLPVVADVTGAGDALAGVSTSSMMQGTGFQEAVRRGMAAAMLTIASPTVVTEYDDAAFAMALALVGEAQQID
jgi:pseudouridine kinase